MKKHKRNLNDYLVPKFIGSTAITEIYKTKVSLSIKTKIQILLSVLLSQLLFTLVIAQESKVKLIIENGHTLPILSVAFSPNGKIIASASRDSTIKLWEAATGKLLKTLSEHFNDHGNSSNWNWSIAFSPNGKMLASANSDQTIKLWNVETGLEIKTLKGHEEVVYRIAFSPDGRILASWSWDHKIKLWNLETMAEIKSYNLEGYNYSYLNFTSDSKTLFIGNGKGIIYSLNLEKESAPQIFAKHPKLNSLIISPNGKQLVSGSEKSINFWNALTGKLIKIIPVRDGINSLAFSPDGKTLAVADIGKVSIFNTATGRMIKYLEGLENDYNYIWSIAFSPDGKTLIGGADYPAISVWDIATGKHSQISEATIDYASEAVFSPNNKLLANSSKGKINLWYLDQQKLLTLDGEGGTLSFSPDSTILATSTEKGIKLWNIKTGREFITLKGYVGVSEIVFSNDGKYIAAGKADSILKSKDSKLGGNNFIKLWEIKTGKEILTLKLEDNADAFRGITFSADGMTIVSYYYLDKKLPDNSSTWISAIKQWDLRTGRIIQSSSEIEDNFADKEILKKFPGLDVDPTVSPNGIFQAIRRENNTVRLVKPKTEEGYCDLISLNGNNWIVMTSSGRFDTNKSLDKIEGLHWIVNDEILKPLPLDIFMRQYYEPGLLPRVLKCTEENNCDKEFKPLPSIADINHIQPKVEIKEIKPNGDSADVTVEVENVTEDVSFSATDRTKKKQLFSGVFDLRLFRNGQLVGVSTPPDKLEKFINDAPRLVAETKASGKLIDTPEDIAWRKANDIFQLKSENVKFISPDKIQYIFRNVKLPKDGHKEVEFTAYAFNSDKVKSTTTEPVKFTVPNAVVNAPKKGRAYLISIGVNASENPAYNLRYAANDARKMQEIVGERLKAESKQYSDVIQISLISDYGIDNNLAENTAQKTIIKSVFSLLAGNEKEIPPDILNQIPNHEKIKTIEPEDTLIITYSGHGYADQSGIFYLLPYDIGKVATKLNAEVLQKTISSDELSLWMQNITAKEMVMVIDACHSAAAVQGDNFKPGPMGSRGLGQLAYDKDMKILSATQADNVALELNSLQQGLLSYALLQDGVIKALADEDKNKQLSTTEWLSYAEKRVPELYQEVKDSKRDVVVDGRNIKADGAARAEIVLSKENQKSSLNLQEPKVFDFKRRKIDNTLFNLP